MTRELVYVEDLDQWLPRAAPEQSTPSAEDEYFETLGWNDTLECLTPRQRFVIELRCGLRDGRNYSVREVAAFMGVTHQAVVAHERRARAKLAVAMGMVARAVANSGV